MNRWPVAEMLEMGKKLFAKMHMRKYHANHNHEIHFMAREIEDWLPAGVKALKEGTYTPRPLRRYYFSDEMVDQLHPSDRIFQHILLKILKPTFKYVMNPNCYHLHGPTGVKYATRHIRQVLTEKKPAYLIRADIKSFYKSIPHDKLIANIKQHYHDPKLLTMLQEIITNPIDAPNGFKNPSNGIALRGPLSQFFSGIYLKPLDDAFNHMEVTYIRFQDDVLILCQTKRQFNRCRRRLMQVLQERRLCLSRKKSRMGRIDRGFHFLGIDYLPTQTEDNTSERRVNEGLTPIVNNAHYLNDGGGKPTDKHQSSSPMRIVPHARTLRKARMQVQLMVHTGFSTRQIRSYLDRFIHWWVNASEIWKYDELLAQFITACWDANTAAYVAGLLIKPLKQSHKDATDAYHDLLRDVHLNVATAV